MNTHLRRRYPKNWEALAAACKESAGWRCTKCQVKHGTKRRSKRTGLPYRVYLHAAHVNHDPGNPNPVLVCLCPTCHAKFDFRSRQRQKEIHVEKIKHRRLLAALYG